MPRVRDSSQFADWILTSQEPPPEGIWVEMSRDPTDEGMSFRMRVDNLEEWLKTWNIPYWRADGIG